MGPLKSLACPCGQQCLLSQPIRPTQAQWKRVSALIVLSILSNVGHAAGEPRSRSLVHTNSPRQGRRFFEDRLNATREALAAAQANLAELEKSSGDLYAPEDQVIGDVAAMHQTAAPALAPSDLPTQEPGPTYNEETKIHDSIPWSYEACVAVLFICVIAGGPILVTLMQDDKLTKTVIVQAAITVLVLLGGMWMFMNVLIFESGHFTGQRSLTLVETVYLMAQILTTVGYGDIVPAYPRGQVVVGCYVLLSLFLIVDMISLISTAVIGRVEKYSMRLTEEAFEEVTMLEGSQTTSQKRPLIFGKQEVSYMSLFSSGGPLLCFVLAGVLFFHYYPGEGKTWLQAIYMSIVTLSTTGFGAFTAVTTGGQVFGAFWMIFGVAALVSFVGAFAELLMKLKENERHSASIMRAEMEANLKKVKFGTKGKLNRDEFLRFAVLQLRIASEEQLKAIEKVFDRRPDPRRRRAAPKPQS